MLIFLFTLDKMLETFIINRKSKVWYIKKCPFCKSNNVSKKGKRKNVQRYKCQICGKWFQNKRRKSKLQNKLWKEYVHGKQTATELGSKYGKCRQWISSQLNEINTDDNKIINIKPQSIIVVVDTVFFTRDYGVTIFREPNLKKNLIWKEVHSETPGQYDQLRNELECLGFTINAVILDGKRGVRQVFSDIPVQMCQFHQVAIIVRYLTRNPILEAGQELRKIALQLTASTDDEFTELLNNWHSKWRKFLKEKTTNLITGKWHYTHKRLRSAHRSLKTNIPYLFTCRKYPELNIPNTCNSLDGSLTTLKNLLRIHRGMSRKNRYKMICQILRN